MHTHRSVPYLAIMFCILLYSGCSSSKPAPDTELTHEQETIRAQLFERIDNMLDAAEAVDADLYSPKNFETGMRHYTNAERQLRQERNIENIRTELDRAAAAFEKAMETAAIGSVTFQNAVQARNDALRADASIYASDSWDKAEAQFRRAAETLEAGNVNRARREAQTAENEYRTVELEAIKANYLNSARDLIRQANEQRVERTAPRTLERAKDLVRQAEVILQQDRYNTDEANRIALEAANTASHALYLNKKILQLRDENKSLEEILLSTEEPIRDIAEAAEVGIYLHEGPEITVEEIKAKIKAYAEREQIHLERIRRQETELAHLRGQIADKTDLAELLEIQRQREEAVNMVINLFSPREGNVFIDGNNVLIRLYGLTFPIGQSVIEPQYFTLLTKVQDAIKRFPDCRVIIEGHTDSRGSYELNQQLSEERAEAVAEYIRANIGIPLDITSMGYGPDSPVASNETEEGRARNRRIDVVIIPDW